MDHRAQYMDGPPALKPSTKQSKLDEGWPESETGGCQALPSKEIVKIELSKSHDIFILREKICRKREREGGCEGVTVWMCRCDIDVQMRGCVKVER